MPLRHPLKVWYYFLKYVRKLMMPDAIHDRASEIKKIRQPMEISSTKQNVNRAIKLNTKLTTVVMAFVLTLLSIQSLLSGKYWSEV